MYHHLYRFCQKAIHLIAILATLAIFLLNIKYNTEIAYNKTEAVVLNDYFIMGLLTVALLAAITALCSKLRLPIDKINEQKLFIFFSIFYTVFAVYLILNTDNILRADPNHVYHAARNIQDGVYNSLQAGGYLYRYPHQLGLVLYEQILFLYSENPSFLFLVNFLMVLKINHVTWKISQELFHDHHTNLLTIFFCFAFFPQLFFILFAYTLIPGFFFMIHSFYYTLRFLHTHRFRCLVGLLVCTAAAVVLKQNYLIGGIAIIIVLLLHFLKEQNIRYVCALLAVVLFMTVPATIIQNYFENKADVELNSPSPTILWIAMGTDIDNYARGPGWYDTSSWDTYNNTNYNSEEAAAIGTQKVVNNIEKIITQPVRAFWFFVHKTASLWCDPLYQSIWSGPLEDCGQLTHTELLQSVYSGGVHENRIEFAAKVVSLMLWMFSFLFIAVYHKQTEGWELMFLYFIGGLMFHTFWEGKSQYIYTYVFSLIPFAAYACKRILEKFKSAD